MQTFRSSFKNDQVYWNEKMITRFLSLGVISIICVASHSAVAQSRISERESGYFSHPTLYSIELDPDMEDIISISATSWPFRVEKVETVKMKFDGTKVIEKKSVAKQKFRSITYKSILQIYSFTDLEGKALTEEQTRKRLNEGAIGIQNDDWIDGVIPSIFRSVFNDRCFLKTWKNAIARESLPKKQQEALKNHGSGNISSSVGIKSIGDEGYYHYPVFFKDITIEEGKMKVTSVAWKAKWDPPRSVDHPVVGKVEVSFGSIIPSVHELKRKYVIDRLEFHSPGGETIDTTIATEELKKPGTVAIFLPNDQKLHPVWAKAMKESVVVISRAPRVKKNMK